MTDDPPAVADDADTSFTEDDLARWHMRARERREVMVLTGIGVLLVMVLAPITYFRSWLGDEIYDVTVISPTELRLSVGECGLERRTRVTEGDEVVRLLVQHRRTTDENDCIEHVLVELERPLGDRRLVDVTTDAAVPVCEGPEGASCAIR